MPFIDVTDLRGKKHLVDVDHIIGVINETIYLDDTANFATDVSRIDCAESYEELRQKILGREKEQNDTT